MAIPIFSLISEAETIRVIRELRCALHAGEAASRGHVLGFWRSMKFGRFLACVQARCAVSYVRTEQ